MPRYRNADGVVVEIPKETAELIGGYTPADEKKPATKEPVKKTAPRKSTAKG